MADKHYKITFELSDGTTKDVEFTSPQGEKGDKGDKGDTGATGPAGANGAKGDKGDKGDTGATGSAGKDGADGQRGHGILKVTTTPASYTTTTGGKAPIKRMSLSTIKSEANVDEVLVGDQICHSYYLYNVYYLDATYAYMDKSQSIRGSTGAAGAAGTSVTITSVTESEESGGENVVTFSDGKTLTVRNGKDGKDGSGGSGGSAENVTLLGQTPVSVTKAGTIRLNCNDECAYTIESDTVAVFDVLSGTKNKVTVAEVDGHYQIVADGTATAWYQQYLSVVLTGLTVEEEYNFVFDAEGMPWNADNYITTGHWILKDSSGTTLLTRTLSDYNKKYAYAFTATTTSVELIWYPNQNSSFAVGRKNVANVGAIYVNRAGTSDLTEVMSLSGSFTGSETLYSLPPGVTISSDPVCTVYSVTGGGNAGGSGGLSGKTVVCFGDSLFGMYRGDDSAPAFVAQETGATVHNVGFGGCRMSVHPSNGYAAFSMWALAKAISEKDWTTQDAQASSGSDYFPEQLELLKSIDFSKVDIAVIHYGTNDFTGGGSGVSIDNASDADDYNTLCGALRYSLDKLLSAYPKLRVYVSLPVFRYWTTDGVTKYPDTYTNVQGKTLIDFVEALRDVATEYSVPVIDGYYGMGINKVNAPTFFTDGTHHNIVGRERFGRFIGAKLISQG